MPSNATIDRNGKTSMIMIPAKNYEHPSLAYIDLGTVRLILINSSNQGHNDLIFKLSRLSSHSYSPCSNQSILMKGGFLYRGYISVFIT